MIDLNTITVSRLTEIQKQTAEYEGQQAFKKALRAVLNREPFGCKYSLSALGEVGRLYTSGKISKKQAEDACGLFAENAEISAKYAQSLLPICFNIVTGLSYNPKFCLEKEYINSLLKFFKPEEVQKLCLKVAEILNKKEEEKKNEAIALAEEKTRLGIAKE